MHVGFQKMLYLSYLIYIVSVIVADMDAAQGQGLYPLHRCKTIHLVDVFLLLSFLYKFKMDCGL